MQKSTSDLKPKKAIQRKRKTPVEVPLIPKEELSQYLTPVLCGLLEYFECVFYSKSKDYYSGQPKNQLSNFYRSPFIIDGTEYASVECFYQIRKFQRLGTQDMVEQLLSTNQECLNDPDPLSSVKAKKLALQFNKKISETENSKWNEDDGEAEKVMYQGLLAKFTQNENLKNFLLSTGIRYLSHFSKFRPSLALQPSGRSAYKWSEMKTSIEVLSKAPEWKKLRIWRPECASREYIVGQNMMGRLLMRVRLNIA